MDKFATVLRTLNRNDPLLAADCRTHGSRPGLTALGFREPLKNQNAGQPFRLHPVECCRSFDISCLYGEFVADDLVPARVMDAPEGKLELLRGDVDNGHDSIERHTDTLIPAPYHPAHPHAMFCLKHQCECLRYANRIGNLKRSAVAEILRMVQVMSTLPNAMVPPFSTR